MDVCTWDWGALGQWAEVFVTAFIAWQAYKWYYVRVYWVGSSLGGKIPASLWNSGDFLAQDIFVRLDPPEGYPGKIDTKLHRLGSPSVLPANTVAYLRQQTYYTAPARFNSTDAKVHVYFKANGFRWHRDPEGHVSCVPSWQWELVKQDYGIEWHLGCLPYEIPKPIMTDLRNLNDTSR